MRAAHAIYGDDLRWVDRGEEIIADPDNCPMISDETHLAGELMIASLESIDGRVVRTLVPLGDVQADAGLLTVASDTGAGVPEGYAVVNEAELDRWLTPLADQTLELLEATVLPSYMSLALMQPGIAELPDQNNPCRDSIRYLTSACMMGYHARAVEFRELRLDEGNERLTDFLARAARGRSFGDDWFATMNGTADLLARMSQSGEPLDGDLDELLRPEGMGLDVRGRLSDHLLHWLSANHGASLSSAISSGAPRRVWNTGYYLRSCEMALPAEAPPQLGRS